MTECLQKAACWLRKLLADLFIVNPGRPGSSLLEVEESECKSCTDVEDHIPGAQDEDLIAQQLVLEAKEIVDPGGHTFWLRHPLHCYHVGVIICASSLCMSAYIRMKCKNALDNVNDMRERDPIECACEQCPRDWSVNNNQTNIYTLRVPKHQCALNEALGHIKLVKLWRSSCA